MHANMQYCSMEGTSANLKVPIQTYIPRARFEAQPQNTPNSVPTLLRGTTRNWPRQLGGPELLSSLHRHMLFLGPLARRANKPNEQYPYSKTHHPYTAVV
jgi:hypothetical protein